MLNQQPPNWNQIPEHEIENWSTLILPTISSVVFLLLGIRRCISRIWRTISDKIWMTGDSRTDFTRAGPKFVKDWFENEQIIEQIAAFKTDEIFEKTDDTVSQEIMLISEPSPEARKANIKQNSATKGRHAMDGGTSSSKSLKKGGLQRHCGCQSLSMQRDLVCKKMTIAFSILEADSLDHVAWCKCNDVISLLLRQLRKSEVRLEDYQVPSRYFFGQTWEANPPHECEILPTRTLTIDSVVNGSTRSQFWTSGEIVCHHRIHE